MSESATLIKFQDQDLQKQSVILTMKDNGGEELVTDDLCFDGNLDSNESQARESALTPMLNQVWEMEQKEESEEVSKYL